MSFSIWTPEGVEALRRGEIPEGYTRKQAFSKAREIGVKLPSLRADVWTAEEVELLKSNKPIPTRKIKACYNKAAKMGINYHPYGYSFAIQHQIAQDNKGAIIDMLRRTGQIRATARMFGVSYATVSKYGQDAGITYNKSPKDLKGDSIIWGGSCWCWCTKQGNKGFWRETTGKRRNLARVIYEMETGQKIPPKHCVLFKNGDRSDLRFDNLELISASNLCKRQYEDPIKKAATLAGSALGRLNKLIRYRTDTAYHDELKAKMAESARIMRQRKSESHG